MVNGEEDDSEHGTLLPPGTLSDGQPLALYAAEQDTHGALQGGPAGQPGKGPSSSLPQEVPSAGVLGAVTRGVNVDVHACVQEDGAVAAVHEHAEDFDPATEDSFKYLQVRSRCA